MNLVIRKSEVAFFIVLNVICQKESSKTKEVKERLNNKKRIYSPPPTVKLLIRKIIPFVQELQPFGDIPHAKTQFLHWISSVINTKTGFR